MAADDPVELEREVGERLADPVVQVTGDTGAFLVGTDGPQPGEPSGVVEGHGERWYEAGEQTTGAVVTVTSSVSGGTTTLSFGGVSLDLAGTPATGVGSSRPFVMRRRRPGRSVTIG